MSRNMKVLLGAIAVVIAIIALFGCSAIVAQPASAVHPASAPSLEVAMRAALSAASSTNWTPTTVSAETGYILAERGSTVIGRDSNDAYRLEVQLPPNGSGEVRARVVPPSGVMGGSNTSQMVSEYLAAFDLALLQ